MRKQRMDKKHLLMVGLLTSTALCFAVDPTQAASSYGWNGDTSSGGAYSQGGGSSSTSSTSTSSSSSGGASGNVANTVNTTNPVSLDSNGKPVITPIFMNGAFVASLNASALDTFMTSNGQSLPVCPPTHTSGGSSSSSGGGSDTRTIVNADGSITHEVYESGISGGVTHTTTTSGSSSSSSSSSSSGSKVICTWFYQRGELDEILYFADIESAKHLINPITVRGYHAWGISYVKHLRKNPDGLAAKIIRPVVMRRAREIGFQMGVHDKPDYLGKFFRLILEPTCYVIGMFVSQNDWRALYNASDFRAFAEGYRRYQTFKTSFAI